MNAGALFAETVLGNLGGPLQREVSRGHQKSSSVIDPPDAYERCELALQGAGLKPVHHLREDRGPRKERAVGIPGPGGVACLHVRKGRRLSPSCPSWSSETQAVWAERAVPQPVSQGGGSRWSVPSGPPAPARRPTAVSCSQHYRPPLWNKTRLTGKGAGG